MFTTSKWKQNKYGTTCFLRDTGKGQKIIDLTKYKVAIIDVPQSMGDSEEERINYIKEILSTERVEHIENQYYKAIMSSNYSPVLDNSNVFRNIYVVPDNIGITTQIMGVDYHSNYIGGELEKTTYTHKPRVCFWNLEVEVSDTDVFSDSKVNPITMISYASNTLTNVELYTTLPEKYTTRVPCILFEQEKDMIEHLYINLKRNDIDCTYGGCSFGWPYLIERLRQTGSNIIEESKDEVITVENLTSFYEAIDSFSLDHFDLMSFFKVAYPHFKNHKLSTVAEQIVKSKKIRFDIKDLKKLMVSNMTSESTQELQDLATNFMTYSIQGTQLLMDIWDKMYPYISNIVSTTGISYSMVGTQGESIAFMYKHKPQMLLSCNNKDMSRIPKPFMDPGVYNNVYQYDFIDSMINALISSEDHNTSEMGRILTNYRFAWIVKEVFLNPMMKPNRIIPHDNVIGITQNSFFVNFQLVLDGNKVEPISTHKKIIVISSGSWISIEDNFFHYNGYHPSCNHENKLIKYMVEAFITKNRSMSEEEIKTIIPNFNMFKIDDFSSVKKITFFNYEKYTDVLTEEQVKKIGSDSSTWIKIRYLHLSNGRMSTLIDAKALIENNPGACINDIVNMGYYIKQIVDVLKKVSKSYNI
jgi:hypothetical protein